MFITDPADLAALKQEAVNDPKGIGLTLLEADDAANAARLNNEPVAPQTTMKILVSSVATADVYNACDPIELQALTQPQLMNLQIIMGWEQVFPDRYPNIVHAIEGMFGVNSKSLAAVRGLLYRDGSRAEQMHQDGLFTQPYYITPSDYANARQLP
jgi:hypothetical protein